MIIVTAFNRVSSPHPLPTPRLPPCRNGDLVLNGRPRAHQEVPIRALHSPTLQNGIDQVAIELGYN